MEQYQEIWVRMLDNIRIQLDQNNYDTWFKPMSFLTLKDSTLQIEVPTAFFKKYIEEHFISTLHEEAKKYFGIKDVKLTVRSQTTSQPSTVPQRPIINSHLRRDYTFENFIIGDANKFARSIAFAIATRPYQTAFNPFFLYGVSGVGKSHLVNAVGLKLIENNPTKRVLYISAHDFLMQYFSSVTKKTTNDFMYFYQSVECLIIDDIHEISGRKGVQEAFFNIFNHLQRNGRQIIFTSDKTPSQLVGFEERVSSRFVGGATAELLLPDEHLRTNILKAKIRKNQLAIPPDVIQYITQNVTGNVRDLEGVVNNMLAQSIVNDCDIDLNMAQHIVTKYVRFTTKTITIDLILHSVCKYYKITQRDINSTSRKSPIACARQVAMYLAQKHTSMSSTQIGISIGRRDHSTVLHACNQVDLKIKTVPTFKAEVQAIEQDMVK